MIPISLNPRVRGLRRSATLAIAERSRALEGTGRRVFRFGLGQSPFPVPEAVVDALRHHASKKDYLPVQGLPALCAAVADFHVQRDRVRARPEDVLIGPGSKELLFLLQLVFGGELLVPTPCWVSYTPQARILGRKVIRLPTTPGERWRLSPEILDARCRADGPRPRLLVLNYPGNPDGGTYDDGSLEELANVARRHGIIILSDEIYALLHHRGEHVSVGRFYPEGTVISGGLSKWCGAGGWRLGTFTFPQELSWMRDAMIATASETYTSVSAPIQHAAVTAFQGGSRIESYLAHARRILATLGKSIAAQIRAAGVEIHTLEGGFYLMLDFTPLAASLALRGITDSPALCERLLGEAGVALLPGLEFERPKAELTARLAYVDFDGARALQASKRHALEHPLPSSFIQEYCASVVDGVDALCAWLTRHPSREAPSTGETSERHR